MTLTDISSLRIGHNEIEFMEQIGKVIFFSILFFCYFSFFLFIYYFVKGGFGTVWRAKTRGQLVAVKKLGINDDPTFVNHDEMLNLLREFRREVWVLFVLFY